MALGATMHRYEVALSDVDRELYATLDVRLARHPSESWRYLMTRLLAYCLSHEDGIAFSKGGLSSTDEPPLAVRDATGVLTAWIDVGAPSAERLHKAAKAARRVAVFTHVPLEQLRREAEGVHRAAELELFRLDPAMLDALEPLLGRQARLELMRHAGRVYVTVDGTTVEGSLEAGTLAG